MASDVVKRSVVIAGHKTSVSLEDDFWAGLKFVAGEKRLTISELLSAIDEQRQQDNFFSAIRQFVFNYYVALVARLERNNEQVDSSRAHLPSPARKSSGSS
jgi:predicted DNA-binding ribbon-helix-helix protein